MRIYQAISLVLMLLFAVTGMLFLFLPDKISIFFNTLSVSSGMPPSPVTGWSFYLILAAGYMYLVTVLAFRMFKNPGNSIFPVLLTHAKIASSIFSLALFLLHAHYLIYLANFIVDGLIGILVLILYFNMRNREWAYS